MDEICDDLYENKVLLVQDGRFHCATTGAQHCSLLLAVWYQQKWFTLEKHGFMVSNMVKSSVTVDTSHYTHVM